MRIHIPSLTQLFARSPQSRPTELTFEDIARGLGTVYKKIIVLTGAGVSVNSGIPDFRSPTTGLYQQLPHAEELLFDFNYFRKDPVPFFTLLRAMYKNAPVFHPTPVHYFLRLLYDKKLLVRNYTQNVDSLEVVAGLPPSMVIEAHGTLRTSHCLSCRKVYDDKFLKEKLLTSDVVPTCPSCGGIVKPDVCFFNESAFPTTFFTGPRKDFPGCDLVIILGTSLQVQPFASLYHRAPPNVPRLVINKTHTVPVPDYITMNPFKLIWRLVFGFPTQVAYPSMMYLGDCDEAVMRICKIVGWEGEILKLMHEDEQRFAQIGGGAAPLPVPLPLAGPSFPETTPLATAATSTATTTTTLAEATTAPLPAAAAPLSIEAALASETIFQPLAQTPEDGGLRLRGFPLVPVPGPIPVAVQPSFPARLPLIPPPPPQATVDSTTSTDDLVPPPPSEQYGFGCTDLRVPLSSFAPAYRPTPPPAGTEPMAGPPK
ncbi:putative NAD-dependent protein deacetylase Sirt2 [Paratrimastix pyriformis]|uniref:NAD-dependent protein deacetylase Sirt2 n=1 Tax=Paratrimastix pyriformis TaxID=342808 RepID=A0ABQ8UQV6_9EUKA|nr:putative NAD-dependent protein deacetylase Sirt2 [Paratrimastix pyriformis]